MALADNAQVLTTLAVKDLLSPGINKALGSVGKLNSGLGRTAQGFGQVHAGLVRAGTRIAAVSAGAAVGAAKIAIDFDEAFSSVQKNVEGGTVEIGKLKDDLHALATRIPVGFKDLSAIAAEAGALGIATPDVARFTETIARLSASTQGLTVEAASEAFGKFRNSLHLTEAEIERSASALVTLGKTAGSSEGDIIEVAKRFAGSGHAANLSAAQILGLSSAIASLGVAPEAAGGSLSRLFNKINLDIGTGDKKLQFFAKTAGKTTKEFAQGFKKDALGSFEDFLKGLSKLKGPEQAALLKSAGITNVRDISALQLLAGSWQEVAKQTDAATASFKANTDLTDTSNKKFDTVHAKLAVLGNNFKEVAFQIGEGMLPAIGRASTKLTALLQDKGFIAKAQKIGQTLGDALDSIDWNQVVTGAQAFADALKPALTLAQGIFNILNALPTEVKGAGLGLITLDKLSGGLIGGGVGNIIGGLGESVIKGGLSHVPGVSSLVATPVRVVNFPPGFGGGGIGGGGGTTGGIGAAGKVFLVGEAIGLAATVEATRQEISNQNTQRAKAINDTVNRDVTLKTPEELITAIAGVKHGIERLNSPLLTLVRGNSQEELKASLATLEKQLAFVTAARSTPHELQGRTNAQNTRDFATLATNVSTKGDQTKTAIGDAKLAITNETRDAKNRTVTGLTTVGSQVTSGTQGTTSGVYRTGAATVAAIHGIPAPVTNVDVTLNVSGATVEKSIKVTSRAGPSSGSSGGGGGGGGSGARGVPGAHPD